MGRELTDSAIEHVFIKYYSFLFHFLTVFTLGYPSVELCDGFLDEHEQE